MLNFTYKVKSFNDKNISLKEITFKDFKSLVKLILNDDNFLINEFSEKLLKTLSNIKSLNLFEKILCLLTLRSICISSVLEFTIKCTQTNKDFNFSTSINDIINNFLEFIKKNNEKFYKQISYNNNFKVNLAIPDELYINFNEESLFKFIQSVELNGTIYNKLTPDQIGSLPANVFSDIKDFLVSVESCINDFSFLKIKSPFANSITTEIKFSLLQNSFFEFFKILFKKNLLELYELEYVLSSKAKLNYSLIQKSTYAENLLFLNLLKTEMEEKNKASNPRPQSQLNIPPVE